MRPIQANTARAGGGMKVYRSSSATLYNVDIINNTGSYVGGGIQSYGSSRVEMTGGSLTFNRTTTGGGGGGIYQGFGSTLLLYGVRMAANSTTAYGSGGGIHTLGGQTVISSSTIQGNTTGGWGGAEKTA